MSLLLAFFMGVPPLRLAYSGFGELAEAILISNLIPAFAFMLQYGELHRLVPMLTFPILALYMAARLALALPQYASDTKKSRRSMLVLLGWQRGMTLHNLLIPTAFVLLAVAALLGLSWNLTWPALLTLPVGIYEIFQVRQIAAGARPQWQLLRFTATVLPALFAYLIAIALWTS
jgi:1,4-dihydroxy-2-naphthoate octaprenyltransferase